MRQKTNYSELPNRVVVERIGASAVIYLSENIEEIKVEDSVSYLADTYAISTANTPDLETRIEQNFAVWLAHAKNADYETVANDIRKRRNELLTESDADFLVDRAGLWSSGVPFVGEIDGAAVKAVADYRQALRDITKQDGFPYDVVWPKR
jgi:hypothetical protein